MEKSKIETEFKSKGTISKTFTIPLLIWEEWERDCKENFNNTYFLKLQHDHKYRKDMESLTALVVQDLVSVQAEVQELRERVNQLESKPVEEKKTKTFGA